ncbi:MAG: hypothetical protein WCC06_11630 [Candidatus Aminicenantales bacterium]
MRARLILSCFGLFWSGIALAGDAEKAVLDRWYTALGAVDRTAITGLLAENAKITLGDLDIEQSKAEFVASLDEWADAMKGSAIRHGIEKDEGGLMTAIVCYKFPDNESLTREVFAFEGGQIKSSEQETVADSCAEFP